jgi:hypothetical protein
MEPWEKTDMNDKREQSQNLLMVVEALTRGGFAVLKIEALPYSVVSIQCAYLGNSGSPKSDPVTK